MTDKMDLINELEEIASRVNEVSRAFNSLAYMLSDFTEHLKAAEELEINIIDRNARVARELREAGFE